MRIAFVLAASLALTVLAGCFSNDGTESTSPTSAPVTGQPPGGGLGYQDLGCTGNHTVGAGNGDITSDHACPNATANATSAHGPSYGGS